LAPADFRKCDSILDCTLGQLRPRFSYNGSDRAYVGVMAQEVQQVMPQAVVRERDGYLRVYYDKIGVKFQSYEHWLSSGARLPSAVRPDVRSRLDLGQSMGPRLNERSTS